MAMQPFSAPSKELDALIPAGLIRHGGHPVLSWCASNAALKRDHNENIKYVKGASQANRIDLVVALVIALACYMTEIPEEDGEVFFI